MPWQAVVDGDDATLGQLLRGLEQQDQKKCDTDAGGCDAPSAVQHFLLLHGERPPDVFTLQLAWESTREDPEDIRDTLDAITEARHAGRSFRVYGALGINLPLTPINPKILCDNSCTAADDPVPQGGNPGRQATVCGRQPYTRGYQPWYPTNASLSNRPMHRA